MVRPQVGFMYQREAPPELLRTRVRLFEELGLDDVWIVEDLGFACGIAMAATALEATSRLNAGHWHPGRDRAQPAVRCMELAALARLHPGRVIPGIGHGMQDWMEQTGALPASLLQALEEALTSVRALLDGSTLDMRER